MRQTAASTPELSLVTNDVAASARGYWSRAWSRLLRNRVAVAGLVVIAVVALIALAAPLIAPADPSAQDVLNSRQGPSMEHLAGTDSLGRDLLSRLIYGARVSLSVGVFAQAVILGIGLPLGLIAGYRGGWADNAIMRFTDLVFAFPDLLLIILLRAVLGGNIFTLFLIIGFVSWVNLARLVRGQVLSLREREFVEAARSLGASDREIMTRHLLPNLTGPLVVMLAMGVPRAIFIEAALSFIGFGVDPTTPTWGAMVQEGQSAIGSASHLVLFPSAAIALVTLAFTFLGDGLRDALDPHVEDGTRPSEAAETRRQTRRDGETRDLPRAA
ncbi:MAG TPA: ABC transporter permease [Dehalococcoidia bacterium]|nr:ABC transporter permease [Dehalococcoidia bacterium]